MPCVVVMSNGIRRSLVVEPVRTADPWGLDLDDVGTEVRQNGGCGRACDETGQVRDFQAGENTFNSHGIYLIKLGWSSDAGSSPALKFWSAFFKKDRRAFLLVFGRCTNRKKRTFDSQTFSLACLHPFVYSLDRKFDGERGVGIDLLQDSLSSGDQTRAGYDLVDQA